MEKLNIVIRVANFEDLEEIVGVRMDNAIYHANLSEAYKVKKEAYSFMEKHSKMMISNENSIIFLAEINKKIVGYAIGILKGQHPIFELPKIAFIEDIFISIDHQNKGIGKELIKALQSWFKKTGVGRIELKVFNLNKNGIQFWEKMGFNCDMLGMTKSIK